MFKKIAIGFVLFFVLLIGAVIAIPFLFKDKINALIKEQINKELLADVDYGSYDLSIIKSFPDLYFTLNDLQIVGRNEFEGDTLARIKQIGFGMELMKFVRNEEILINSINLIQPKLVAYTLVTENGDTLSNYDILPPSNSKTDTSALLGITVNDVHVEEAHLIYKDFTNGMELLMNNLNLDAKLSYVEDVADVLSDFSIDSLSFNDGNMQYLNKTKLVAKVNAKADLTNNVYTLADNEIILNALKLHADGVVSLPDSLTTTVDLKFAADKSTFKELISLIPAYYMKDYKDLEANGQFDLSGFAKGNITETETPAFNINLSIANGSIKYPDLPAAVNKINLKANLVNNSSNLEQTEVDIPNATFNVAGQDIAMRLNAKNALGDPLVDLAVKGKLPLSKVPEFYPIEGVKKLEGMVDADFAFKGLLSNVENEKYDQIDFSGKLDIANLVVDAADLPMAVKADKFLLNFSPQYASLVASNTVLGQSDFNINGQVENLINYVLADGTIKGNLTVQSKSINLDELLGSEESTTTSSNSESDMTKVPNNVDFNVALKADKIMYDGLELSNVNGGLKVADETATLTNFQTNLLGGSAKIAGAYSTKNTDKPKLDLNWDIQKFDIQQTFNYVNTVQSIAPIAKYLNGTFSTDMDLNTFLNNDLSPDLSMLSGLGKVTIPYASFADMPLFTKIADITKLPALSNKPALNNAWTVLKVEDGKVNVEPFQVKWQDITMNMAGSNGFDQSINYTVKLTVPSDKFGNAASVANNFLSQQKIPLLNLSVPQSITFDLGVTGSFTSPQVKIVKVSADGSDKGIKDQIKDNVVNQVNDIKDQAKDKAQQEIDKAKQQAQEQLDKAKEDAKNKAQEEVDKAKEQAKDKIKDKLKGFGW